MEIDCRDERRCTRQEYPIIEINIVDLPLRKQFAMPPSHDQPKYSAGRRLSAKSLTLAMDGRRPC